MKDCICYDLKMLGAALVTILILAISDTAVAQLEKYNVLWNTPSTDSWGSMPIGNGDIGANIWVSPEGELYVYISKTDAWSENGRLLKIGKIKIAFTPGVIENAKFKQELDLKTGTIRISTQRANQWLDLDFWIDANNPVLILNGQCSVPLQVEVEYEGWRNERRKLTKDELFSAYGLVNSPGPVFVEPDVLCSEENALMWYHRNERSIWEKTLEVQALAEFSESLNDPLIHRTFGAYVQGESLIKISDKKLVSQEPSRNIEIAIFPYTAQAKTVDQWKIDVRNSVKRIQNTRLIERKQEHDEWWQNFWDRHYIFVESSKETEKVYQLTQGYLLQRFINASGGRGNMPIKFNGSIFTVDVPRPVKATSGFDADYRDWGGCYWWQNTRLPYWSMLFSGDFELMEPLFKMYMEALPLAKFRTEKYYNHMGAMFPETMYFWGAWTNDNYGWERTGKPDGLSDNLYIRYEWQGAIELIAMMLDYHSFLQDDNFLKRTIIPFALEILTFYDEHYERDSKGEIVFEPSQALETYWEGTINPMPEIAGLKHVTRALLKLNENLIDTEVWQLCEKLQQELPELPMAVVDGKKVLMPAEVLGPKRNVENPELYAIFPYTWYGLGKPDLEVAQQSYLVRQHKDYWGWQQDGIQAAYLGLRDEASRIVLDNFNTKHEGSRFPAFWGPNYDWVPDQDHGSVNIRALQNMLIQTDGKKIMLFPAWPANWDVDFRLHAPHNTIVEGKLENGEVVKLKVNPQSREEDIEVYLKNY
jgi:alpha-L-fucosidase 2